VEDSSSILRFYLSKSLLCYYLFNVHDLFVCRYQHERAIAQGGYGLLLTRWDKRAPAGQELLNQSDNLLQKVPAARLSRDDSNDSGNEDIVIPLNGMLQLPL